MNPFVFSRFRIGYRELSIKEQIANRYNWSQEELHLSPHLNSNESSVGEALARWYHLSAHVICIRSNPSNLAEASLLPPCGDTKHRLFEPSLEYL